MCGVVLDKVVVVVQVNVNIVVISSVDGRFWVLVFVLVGVGVLVVCNIIGVDVGEDNYISRQSCFDLFGGIVFVVIGNVCVGFVCFQKIGQEVDYIVWVILFMSVNVIYDEDMGVFVDYCIVVFVIFVGFKGRFEEFNFIGEFFFQVF